VNRPVRKAGIRLGDKLSAEGATLFNRMIHKIREFGIGSVPHLRRSLLISSKPRPHGRGYSLPALRACKSGIRQQETEDESDAELERYLI
jgi:hypothetical protein